MSTTVIGVGGCAVSADPDDAIVTYALGSCIAVSLHDPVTKIGGMLHFQLPDSALDAGRARENPFMYADSGVPELILRCLELGAQKSRMVVGAAGGDSVTKDNGFFHGCEKTLLGLRKALWKSGLVIHRESIGGEVARSVRLDVGTGDLWIKAGRQEAWIFLPRRAASSNSRSCGGVV